MNKLLKWILGLVATLAILLVIISVALPLLLDPNDYKDEISAAVEQRTGRALAINGDISWRVLPSLGIQIDDVSLANRTGFGARPMLEVNQAAVTVKLLPLFSRRLEVGRVSLDGVSAYLRRNTDGRNNWGDLAGQGRDDAPGDTGQEAIADVEIVVSNGNLVLSNTAHRVDLDGFDDDAQAGVEHHAFELQGEATLTFLQQEISGQVVYQGLMQLVRGRGLLGLQDLELSFTAAGSAVKEDLSVNTDVVLDLARGQARLADLVLQYSDLRAKGELDVMSLSSEPEYKGQFAVEEFNPRKLMEKLGIDALRTSRPDALSRLQLKAGFNGSPAQMNIPELGIVLDDSTLQGRLTIEKFDPLQLVFDLDIDTINLDDYSLLMEAEDAADENVEVAGAGLFVGSMLLFTGGGELGIDHLVAGGLTVEDLSASVTSNAQEIRLFPISSRFYGGQHQGDVQINFSGAPAMVMANQVVTGFEVSGLLRDLADTARVHGTADLYLKLSTALGDTLLARRSLAGDVGLSVIDGYIDEVDIRGAVDKVTALLGRGDSAATAIGDTDRMEFSELIVSGIVERGILKSDDLALRSVLVNATGEGTINLNNETINYVIYPVPSKELAAQLPEDYRNMSVPVRVSGSLYEPDISFDIAAGIMTSQNANIANKAGEAASTLLKGFFDEDKKKKKDGQ